VTRALVRFEAPVAETAAGVRHDDGSVDRLAATMGELLALDAEELRRRVDATPADPVPADAVRLLAPVDGRTEVWAAGVTYRRSRDAREEESAAASVYARVYDAERPELFFKAPAWRVMSDGEPIAVRADSQVDVPEPELALVLNSAGRVVGLTVGNDVSSRTIEGDNPLYLPQAKCYAGSCSLAHGIRPLWDVEDPRDLAIGVRVRRGGAVAWAGDTSTANLHRPLDELVTALFAEQEFPDGAVLLTGTGVVPPLDFTLQAGDEVLVEIEGVGALRNPVVRGRHAWRSALDGAAA
jgi:2-dehydro-3-deoxy-D-arabinonate dehydratase